MSDIKTIRKQIRNVVLELLPNILGSELVAALRKEVLNDLNARLNLIDERQKQIQGYVVRQSSLPKIKE